MGVTLALPLLDGMIPALTAFAKTGAKGSKRLSIIYVPNGMTMQGWTPPTAGPLELTPILAPLAEFKNRAIVLSGLDDEAGKPIKGEGIGEHARGCPSWLSGVHPRKTPGADVLAGMTMDQYAAQHFAAETQLASLELGIDNSDDAGVCDGGYSCAYANAVAWRTPTTPLAPEIDPRAVFERLFGDTSSPEQRKRRQIEDKSILDSISENVSRLTSGLGPKDQSKLSEYLDAVRDIERRIQKAEQQNEQSVEMDARPSGIPQSFEEHMKLQFDLQVLAHQTDMTRVTSFMVGREISTRAYPQIGVPDAHHGLSHHQNDPAKMAKLIKLQTYHMTMFKYYLDKLQATPDGEGTLLDKTTILYGACLSDSNKHDHENLPTLVMGPTDQYRGGRHIMCTPHTPITNLLMTILHNLDVPAEKLGDSNGDIHDLSI